MKLRNHNIKAKRIKIVFDNSSEDYWEAASEGGIELDEAMRLITRAWEKRDKPTEPLIKDEKIRKAVRAWAEACGVNRVVNGEYDNELCAKGQQFYGAKIVLTKTVALPRGRNYTIAELCGEEEE